LRPATGRAVAAASCSKGGVETFDPATGGALSRSTCDLVLVPTTRRRAWPLADRRDRGSRLGRSAQQRRWRRRGSRRRVFGGPSDRHLGAWTHPFPTRLEWLVKHGSQTSATDGSGVFLDRAARAAVCLPWAPWCRV